MYGSLFEEHAAGIGFRGNTALLVCGLENDKLGGSERTLIDSMKTVLEAVVGRVIYSFIMTESISIGGDD